MKKTDEELANETLAEATPVGEMQVFDPATMPVNAGTEEMGSNDIKTPNLRIIQKTSDTGLPDAHVGWFYRSDTNEQLETVDVDLVYVTTTEGENFNKTGTETKKIYYGFYHGTKEPFKIFVRGWSLSGHKDFQTELLMIKSRWRAPMLSLKVKLKTKPVEGVLPEGAKYSTRALIFEIYKDEAGKPIYDLNVERANFLYNSIDQFKKSAMTDEAQESINDGKMNS